MNGLRALLIVLLVANAGYFAWTRGALAMFGTLPSRFSETEPERLSQQIRPQLLQIREDEPPSAPKP